LVSPLPMPRARQSLRIVPLLLFVGVLLVSLLLAADGTALALGSLLTKSLSQVNQTGASSERATIVATFLSDVTRQDYSDAYGDLDDSLLLVMTIMDFSRQMQADDQCFGPLLHYSAVANSERVQNGELRVAYRLTRSTFSHSYVLSFTLRQDLTSRVWLIARYGENSDLGPAPPRC
jgi:hypothetical protein